MLIYHPAFDIYHSAYRILLILLYLRKKEETIEKIRIWDFYLVFPGSVKSITFPKDLFDLKRDFKKITNPYEDLINHQRVFERMSSYQMSALKYLASINLIDSKSLSNNIVKLTNEKIPKDLSEKMRTVSDEQASIIRLMNSPFNDLPLNGTKGLKHRTGLLEFKYDTV